MMICEAWEGLTVDGKYPLLERLLGGKSRCLFLTVRQGINTAGIRLVVADSAEQDKYLARWGAAMGLSHPCLSQVMETGRSSIRGSDLAYAVMEKPDAFLSELIPSKALSPARAKGILHPIVDALSFMHQRGFAHGSLKPSNVLQIGDQWKLASDEMAGAGELAGLTRELDTYDAPEVGLGELTPAADVWSLGIIAIEALAQKTPMWDRAAKGNLGVPEWLPEPFRQIARGCLRWEPSQRISIGEIKGLLEQSASLSEIEPEPATREVVEVKSGAFAAPAAAEQISGSEGRRSQKSEEKPGTALPPVQGDESEDEEGDEEYLDNEEFDELVPRSRPFSTLEKERKGVGRIIFIGVVLLVIGAAVMAVRGYWSEFWRSAESRIAPQSSQPSPQGQAPAAETEARKAAPPSTDQSPPQSQPTAAPQSENPAPGESSTQSQQAGAAQNPPAMAQPTPEKQVSPTQPSSTVPEKRQPTESENRKSSKEEAPAPRPANAPGAITKRVLPSVASGARESMRRPIEVEVQVSVNDRGAVSDATCLTQGRGNYFARVSVQAAQSWRFQPPVSNGQPRPSEWTLRFHYDRSRVDVTATEAR